MLVYPIDRGEGKESKWFSIADKGESSAVREKDRTQGLGNLPSDCL